MAEALTLAEPPSSATALHLARLCSLRRALRRSSSWSCERCCRLRRRRRPPSASRARLAISTRTRNRGSPRGNNMAAVGEVLRRGCEGLFSYWIVSFFSFFSFKYPPILLCSCDLLSLSIFPSPVFSYLINSFLNSNFPLLFLFVFVFLFLSFYFCLLLSLSLCLALVSVWP